MSEGSGMDAGALTRRRFIAGASVLALGGIAARAGAARAATQPASARVALGRQPHGLPAGQHAWGQTLAVDRYGNQLAPRFDRLLFFDVREPPTLAHARLLESRLRALERRFHWGPGGLLFTVSWGPTYFTDLLGVRSPVPRATRLASFESPEIDDYHVCLHLASDHGPRLREIERALVHGHRLHGVQHSLSLAPVLRHRATRTGFVGAGLPAAHQHVHGIPAGRPVGEDSPLYMGFHSSLRKNQATERDVTIPEGPFRHGTTMQVSYMRLALERWYDGLTERQRVARMYSPQTTVAQVQKLTSDAAGDPGQIDEAIKRYGVVGHAQATAQARRHGRPLIIRRDFNTVDGGYAGLHFVSVQRSIDDFVVTRNAMNAAIAHQVNREITATSNNGINAFIGVRRRANYVMPSRADRSFPLLPGRDSALI